MEARRCQACETPAIDVLANAVECTQPIASGRDRRRVEAKLRHRQTPDRKTQPWPIGDAAIDSGKMLAQVRIANDHE
jgi:hypothetical protein